MKKILLAILTTMMLLGCSLVRYQDPQGRSVETLRVLQKADKIEAIVGDAGLVVNGQSGAITAEELISALKLLGIAVK